ncbi:hypothetical protein Bbelb_037300 [Branchiostoma belcheri]|nr:hypothetical protein Bbelb_037300 [Branchiostoma belcheri]
MGGEYRIRVSMKLLVFVLWLWMGNSALTVKQADHLKDRLKRLKTKIDGVNLKVAQTARTLNNMAERGFPKVPDVPTATPGSVSNNHPGYTEREGSFYKVFRYQTDHASAQQTCEADGGRLADVKTEALNNFIVGLISATGNAGDNSYWIGLNDKATEGTYMWADGSRLASCAFSNWAPGPAEEASCNEVTKKWRDDLRCGGSYTTEDGRTAECDPDSIYPCCSPNNWCGNTADHCDCADCVDYRDTESSLAENAENLLGEIISLFSMVQTGETSQDLDSQTPHEDSEQIVEKLREKPKRSGNNKMGTKNGKSKKHNRA